MLWPQVMEIHQVVVTASPGDAITNAAFETRKLLRRDGGRSTLYARFIDPELLGDVLPLDHFPAPRPDLAILYHASIGQAASDMSVARDKILINLPEIHPAIWMTQIP